MNEHNDVLPEPDDASMRTLAPRLNATSLPQMPVREVLAANACGTMWSRVIVVMSSFSKSLDDSPERSARYAVDSYSGVDLSRLHARVKRKPPR